MKLRLFFVCASLVAGACSSSDDSNVNDAGHDATANDAGADVLVLKDTGANDTGSGDSSATDAGIDAPIPDIGCLTDDAGCENCCFNNHPDGAATYIDTLFTCACSKGATCHSASKCLNNLCAGNASTTTCDNCLDNPDAGDCNNKADKACAGDPDCVALITCIDGVCAPPSDASAD